MRNASRAALAASIPFLLAVPSLAGCPSAMGENVRVKAATDLSCDQNHVEVEEIDTKSAGPNAPMFTPDTKTYLAMGCGKTGMYVCNFSQSKCERAPV